MNKKFHLGISAYYHDSAAALVSDDSIIFATQEERFSRIKNDLSFPENSIRAALKFVNVTLEAIDTITFYENPLIKLDRIIEHNKFQNIDETLNLNRSIFDELNLSNKLASTFDCSKKSISKKLKFSNHHLSHAASSFYCSKFTSAAILVVDAVGEWDSASIFIVDKNGTLKKIWSLNFPQSLGLLYSAFSFFCGFKVNSGEYKLMGLAPYGRPIFSDIILEKIVKIEPNISNSWDPINIDCSFYKYQKNCQILEENTIMYEELFNIKSNIKCNRDPILYADIASSIQYVLNKAILRLSLLAKQLTGENKLCMAGGVALNCISNSNLLRNSEFEEIFIQPAAGDAGGALGAALLAARESNERPLNHFWRLDNVFLGTYCGNDLEIRNIFEEHNIISTKINDKNKLAKLIANEISKENVIAICQGRAEFGPRSLGNRSIIADPRIKNIKDKVNSVIKYRESFRPFAPVIHLDKLDKYFKEQIRSDFMLFTYHLKDKYLYRKDNLIDTQKCYFPGITHVDGSARVQTIERNETNFFSNILSSFEDLTNCPMLLNTSFNVRGEPLVNSYIDALNTFFGSSLDILILESYVIYKSNNIENKFPLECWYKNIKLD